MYTVETTFKIFLNIFFEKIFIWDRQISKFSRFSLDIANLDHHSSQTSNQMTKWLGTVVHLHEEKVQLLLNVSIGCTTWPSE